MRKRIWETFKCLGRWFWTDAGQEFDCDYEYAPSCEECIVNYEKTGGRINPATGKKYKIRETKC